MKKLWVAWNGSLALCLLACAGWARPGAALAPGGPCGSRDSAVIDAEAHCVENGGIDIGFFADSGAKVACMENKQVQTQCGAQGRLTRMRAYSLWLGKLRQFEAACIGKNGTFSFDDPNFVEPQNENFCLPAQPEVSSNMFEEPLCNYRSLCPAATVTCRYACGDEADLSYDPMPSGN